MQDALYYSREIDSLEDALRLLQLPEPVIETIYNGICGDEAVRETIRQLLEDLDIPNLTFPNPVCDADILNDLVRWGLDAARNILDARTHQDLCR